MKELCKYESEVEACSPNFEEERGEKKLMDMLFYWAKLA